MDTKNYNKATKFFRDMEFADPYDNRWGKFADAMDEVISTYVPVVRCKDCKHFEPDGVYTMCYRHNGLSQNADWFCADGEVENDG